MLILEIHVLLLIASYYLAMVPPKKEYFPITHQNGSGGTE
jgi:hypothetical protein